MRNALSVVAALNLISASIAGAQSPRPGDRDPSGRIFTRLVVTISGESGAIGHPVSSLRFLVVTEGGDRISVRTNDAGVASSWLFPGSYRIVTPDPYEYDGNRYTWDAVVPIREGVGIVRLSQSNASKIEAIDSPAKAVAPRPRTAATQGSARTADTPERPGTGKGFHFGLALNGSSFQVDDEDAGEGEMRSGGGLNLGLGYNFSPKLGLVLNFTAANMETVYGDFTLGHADLIGRYSFSQTGRQFVPHLELGLSGIGVLDSEEDVELNGAGGTAGFGFNYFFKRTVALDVGLRYTVGELNTLRVGNVSVSDEDGLGVTTARFNLGVVIFP